MIKLLEKIAFVSVSNFSEAEILLRQIPNDDPNDSFISSVRSRVDCGDAKAAKIFADGVEIGITVYAVETFGPDYRELVSIATKTKDGKIFRFSIESALLVLAKKENCQSLRMHTVRAGLVKDSLANGWEVAEITLRKRL